MNRKLTISPDSETYEKLVSIARQENRFISKQAAYWIKQAIRIYEKQNIVQDANKAPVV